MKTVKQLILDLQDVSAAISLSEAAIQRLVRQNTFPKPRLLSGRRVGWLMREIEEWAEACPISDLLPPENAGQRRAKQDAPTPTPRACLTDA
jgi:prophage regulatory protein